MPAKILIVDDSMRTRLELRDILLSHGFSIVEASSGRDAVEKYERIHPDLVMVDAQMPDMDGVCTIRAIRYKDPDALMLLCAGSGEKSSVMEAMTAGAIDFCSKPYVPKRVITTIRRALSGISH